eukprot:1176006-Prorocentrum_minimum.AAC.5
MLQLLVTQTTATGGRACSVSVNAARQVSVSSPVRHAISCKAPTRIGLGKALHGHLPQPGWTTIYRRNGTLNDVPKCSSQKRRALTCRITSAQSQTVGSLFIHRATGSSILSC